VLKSLEQFKETNYSKILSKKDLSNLNNEQSSHEKKNEFQSNPSAQNAKQEENADYYDEAVFEQITRRNRKLKLLGHTDSIFSISISPDKKYIISGSYDETIRLWSLYTKTTLVVYLGHFAPVLSVKFSPFS
jgi:WD40 repeat protein